MATNPHGEDIDYRRQDIMPPLTENGGAEVETEAHLALGSSPLNTRKNIHTPNADVMQHRRQLNTRRKESQRGLGASSIRWHLMTTGQRVLLRNRWDLYQYMIATTHTGGEHAHRHG